MLDATKYMNRLRLIVLGVDELVYMNKSEQLDYLLNRVKDVVKIMTKTLTMLWKKWKLKKCLT